MLHIDFVSMDIFLNKINILEQQKGYKIYEQVTLKRDVVYSFALYTSKFCEMNKLYDTLKLTVR
ncbi:hypothetical protein KM1_160960 [Entamoeba histolytica HM-3:IMSS]|uniref:Uncharacterized protein n=1 Tax=Entamoeba histolytica HM-3:IMSS TaxID=885315 RepID=M7X0Q5_ENTHI|nr:hypothetical protein KM1_160960 [Entamoeba histolytica HM-3:IMSS]